jgi:two-component system, sensor histidine kinase and response regulator
MDLLDLTRIESGKKKRELREFDIGLLAKSAIDTMMPLAIQRDVTIKYDKNTSIPYVADSEEMDIVFNNLISNAIKYNCEGGVVECRIANIGSELIIVISDTGVGIDDEDLPKLFQEFSRIKTPKTKEVSGSGLGLSIVKRIVDMYNGRIEVDSKVGEGTTFSVYLPIMPSISQITAT